MQNNDKIWQISECCNIFHGSKWVDFWRIFLLYLIHLHVPPQCSSLHFCCLFLLHSPAIECGATTTAVLLPVDHREQSNGPSSATPLFRPRGPVDSPVLAPGAKGDTRCLSRFHRSLAINGWPHIHFHPVMAIVPDERMLFSSSPTHNTVLLISQSFLKPQLLPLFFHLKSYARQPSWHVSVALFPFGNVTVECLKGDHCGQCLWLAAFKFATVN